MRYKVVSGVLLTLLLSGMLTLAFDIQPVKASRTIYINADGSVDPPTTPISSADNITYTLVDNINDSIVVQRNNIVVDGAGYILQGTGSGKGIDLSYISNVTITNMKIKAFNYGISLVESSNNIISGNTITENKYYGIYIGWGSSNNIISGNNIENNDNGVALYYSSNNFLQSNLLDGNQYGFGFLGLELSHFLHSIDTSNLVDGKPVYYLISQHDLTINPSTHPEVGFLALINSTNIAVEGLTMTKNRLGLLTVYTNNTEIQNNNMANNVRGIVLLWSSNNIISGNNITMNGAGIWLSESSNNIISGNNIVMNTDGIELSESSNNRIYHNNFMDNTQQVYIQPYGYSNFWDNGIEGNYWSDYEDRYPDAEEIDESGIWNTSYVIDINNKDNHPLVPEFSSFLILPLFMIATLLAVIVHRRKQS